MMGMADDEKWEMFVRSHRDVGNGGVIRTPFYNLIAENFPIEFMTKLISTAVSSSDHTTTISAAALIQDIAETDKFLEKVKRDDIAVETLELFRRSAIDFMLNHAGGSELQECGEILTARLVRSSLESNGKWEEFLELTKRGFSSSSQPKLLHLILEVFYYQPPELARKFSRLLEPCIKANEAQLMETLLNLLEAGKDHRPYYVLASVCGFFNAEKWTRLMEGAIMSPFFASQLCSPGLACICSARRVSAAASLRFCIDHAAIFHFSSAMISKTIDIVHRLHRSREPWEKHVAVELYAAFTRRVWEVQRKCATKHDESNY